MGARRKVRELALKVLYQKDSFKDGDWKGTFDYLLRMEYIDEKGQKFAKELIEGTLKNLKLIDSTISRFSRHWRMSRISIIDRNILRLACYEMIFRDDIPNAVSIDEAIELSKKYSTDESKLFINGVLDGICKSLKAKREKD